MTTKTYNGRANWETWNVALWVQNDYALYEVAKEAEEYGDIADYMVSNGMTHTPDGAEVDGPELDYEALDDMVAELA